MHRHRPATDGCDPSTDERNPSPILLLSPPPGASEDSVRFPQGPGANPNRRRFLTTAATWMAVAMAGHREASATVDGRQSPLEIRARRLQEIVETGTVQRSLYHTSRFS